MICFRLWKSLYILLALICTVSSIGGMLGSILGFVGLCDDHSACSPPFFFVWLFVFIAGNAMLYAIFRWALWIVGFKKEGTK